MRVTERSRAAVQRNQLQRTTSALATTSEAISSGSRIQRDSEDSVAAASARRAQAVIDRRLAFLEANRQATQQLEASEQVIGLAEDLFLRANELAIQGANDSYSDQQRGFLSREVQGLRDTLVSIANLRERGAFVFGGERDQVAPVDSTGVYIGSGPPRRIPVEESTTVSLITAEDAFGAPGSSAFDAVDALFTALDSGTAADVSTTLTGLRSSLARLTDVRARLGAQQQSAQQAQAFDESLVFAGRIERSQAIDTDFLDAISLLQRQQQALEATLRVQRVASEATRSLFR